MKLLLGILLLLATSFSVDSAKILCIFNIPSLSHQIVFQPIWKELSLRGHEVTVITPNPLDDPTLTNLTEINVGAKLYERLKNVSVLLSTAPNYWILATVLYSRSSTSAEIIFQHPEVSNLINDKSKHFDVVLAEYHTPIGGIFASRFNCPLIAVSSLTLGHALHQQVGNPVHPGIYADLSTPFSKKLSFLERVESTLFSVYMRLLHSFIIIPSYDAVMRKYFGKHIPYFGDIESNVSMIFLNTNPIIHGARVYGPNVIEMGRMHINPKRPLPQDLQTYLDSSKQGVIYFSLGTNVKSHLINEEMRKAMLETFSEIPYNVLWKFENDSLPGKPSNVNLNPWLPQQDVLGHPNIELFITQAGLQSVEEGIVNKVPMLAIPFIFDQFTNAKRIEELGLGLHLDITTFTKEKFRNAILEVIGNSRYKKKTTEIAEMISDEPLSGLEKAVFWTEYVIRHKGAPYFKNPAADIPWHEFLMLDVIGFLIISVLIFSYVSYNILRLLLRMSGFKNNKEVKTKHH